MEASFTSNLRTRIKEHLANLGCQDVITLIANFSWVLALISRFSSLWLMLL